MASGFNGINSVEGVVFELVKFHKVALNAFGATFETRSLIELIPANHLIKNRVKIRKDQGINKKRLRWKREQK